VRRAVRGDLTAPRFFVDLGRRGLRAIWVGRGVPVRAPDGSAEPSAVDLSVHEWSVYRSVLRARFEVVESATGRVPKSAFLTMGGTTLRLPMRRKGPQRLEIPLPEDHAAAAMSLQFRLAGGVITKPVEPAAVALRDDPGGDLFRRFVAEMRALPPGKALEVGSRARSGNVYTNWLPAQLEYTGLDIVAGPNVDVVGDAHELDSLFEPGSFDVVFAIAVFEHLLMPWKAAIAINRVLAPGGLVFVGTHQAFPVHEAPWDFWRFSDQAWRALFNKATGFEILGLAMGEPAEIVPLATTPSVWGIDSQPAFLTSGVLARKVANPTVDWPVSIADVGEIGAYPN